MKNENKIQEKGVYEKISKNENGELESKETYKIPLDKKISLDTFSTIGKEVKLAGRTYEIVPICISDLKIIDSGLLFLPVLGNENADELIFSVNVTDEHRERVFYDVIEKYLKFNDKMVTKELIIEHNWSYKDIKQFLKMWLEVSD